jgi:hypothetical protein
MYAKTLILLLGLVLGSVCLVSAAVPADPINKGPDGVAVRGYDVVAYFTDSKALKGSPQFEYEWKGAKWRFVSSTHRDAFAAAPEKYAPQFGGYCTWTIGHKSVAEGDPEVWSIVDGKLYFNNNRTAQTRWNEDRPKWIIDAGLNWPGLHR